MTGDLKLEWASPEESREWKDVPRRRYNICNFPTQEERESSEEAEDGDKGQITKHFILRPKGSF